MSPSFWTMAIATRLALLRAYGPREYVHAQPIFLYPPQWISDHHAELEAEAGHLVAGFPAAMVEQRVLAALRFDIADRLGEIAVPVQLVASKDDALVPWACSKRLAQAIPDAQLATMDWGGHACNVTDPEGFHAHVLEFLGS